MATKIKYKKQDYIDFEDISTQLHLRRCIVVALAGKHNLLVLGSKEKDVNKLEKATFSLVDKLGMTYWAYKANQRVRYVSNNLKFVSIPRCKCKQYGGLILSATYEKCNCSTKEKDLFIKTNLPTFYLKSDMMSIYDYVSYKNSITTSLKEESTTSIIERLNEVYKLQYDRLKPQNIYNCEMSLEHIAEFCKLDEVSSALFKQGINHLNLTIEQQHSVLRVSRTIADLDNKTYLECSHLAEAIQYKRNLSLY